MSAVSRSRICLVGGVLAILWTLCSSQPGLRAEDGDVSESSLAKVPADVAFYSTSINLRDSALRLAESRLVQQLRAVPFVVQLEAELRKQWESPDGELAQAKGIIESPTAMNLIRLAEDMFASEFFVYGGQDWCESIEELVNVQRELSALADTGEAAMMDYVYGLTKEDIDRLKFPTTVMGFRLTDDENARVQLDFLEGIVRYGLGNVDELRDMVSRLRRSDFNQGQALSLTLDASLIPELQLEDAEQEELVEHVLVLIEDRQLTFEVGVKQGVMLIVISEGGGLIKQFGETDQPLLAHEATLQSHADKVHQVRLAIVRRHNHGRTRLSSSCVQRRLGFPRRPDHMMQPRTLVGLSNRATGVRDLGNSTLHGWPGKHISVKVSRCPP